MTAAMEISPLADIVSHRWQPRFVPMVGGQLFSSRFCPEGSVLDRALLLTRDLEADREECGGDDGDP
ncbi:MAG: hypothetical protein JO286_15185 [Solirubrobacterales bacterium]|nr:hypothetical protein [Solirubrobacterales bacterium]